MASQAKTYTFTGSADGWSWTTQSGSPASAGYANNRLEFHSEVGRNKTAQGYFYITGTFASIFGIASGATVTGYSAASFNGGSIATYNEVSYLYEGDQSGSLGSLVINDGTTRQLIANQSTYTAISQTHTPSVNPSISGLSLPATTSITLYVYVSSANNNNSAAQASLYVDDVSVTIEYSTAVNYTLDLSKNETLETSQANHDSNYTYPYVGQSFQGTGNYITKASMSFDVLSSPVGYAKLEIYAHSGTYGTSSIPVGLPLAVSELLDVSALSTGVLYDYNFPAPFFAASGTNYVLVVNTAGVTSGQAWPDVYTSGGATGNISYGNTIAGITAIAGTDLRFSIYSGDIAGFNVIGNDVTLTYDSGNYTIDATPNQTFALSGVAVTFDWSFACGAGSFALTGIAVNLTHGVAYSIDATPNQTFSLSGVAVSFSVVSNYTLTAVVESFTLTGVAVTLTLYEYLSLYEKILTIPFVLHGAPWAHIDTTGTANTLEYVLHGEPWNGEAEPVPSATLTCTTASFSLSGIAITWDISYAVSVTTFALTGIAVDFAVNHTYTLTAVTESFSLTGIAVTFDWSFYVATTSFSLTGITTPLSVQYTLPTTTASFSLTGIAITWDVSYAVSVTTFTLTGIDVTLTADNITDYPMTATTASFALTGVAITWDVSYAVSVTTFSLNGTTTNFAIQRNYTLTAAVEAFTFAGTATSFAIAITMPTTTVSFSLTGIAITWDVSYVVSVTTFDLTGIATTFAIQRNYTLAATVASFALTGQAITFDWGFYTATVSFTLSGTATGFTVAKNYTLDASPAQTFTLNGNAVTYDWSFFVETTSIVLSAYDITFDWGFPVQTGSFTLTGIDITFDLQRNYSLVTETASFTLTGIVVALTKDLSLDATTTQSFTLTGIAVTLTLGKVLTANTGTFALTGIATPFTKDVTLDAATVQTFTLTGITLTDLHLNHNLFPVTATFTLPLHYVEFAVYHASGGSGSENGSGGTVDSTGSWTNFTTANIATLDTTNYAYNNVTSYTTGQLSNFGFTFGATVPIVGIVMNFSFSSSAANATAYMRWRFSVDGGNTWSNYSTEQSTSGTLTSSVGSDSDTWGLSDLVGADFNSSTDFVVQCDGYVTATNRECRFDYLGLTVYYSATATQEYYMGANLATFALTGIDIDIDLSWAVSVTTFTVTGYDVTLTPETGAFLTVETGTFAVSGIAVNFDIQRTYTLTADVTTYTLTGYAAALSLGNNITMLAATTAFTLTGNDVSFVIYWGMPVTSTSFAVTGNSVNFDLTFVTNVAAFTVTGVSIIFVHHITLPVTVGAYTVTGIPVNLTLQGNYNMTASVASFTLTGIAVSFTLQQGDNYTLPTTTASFAVTGVVVYVGLSMDAAVETFSLSGNEANFSIGWLMDASTTQSFALTGIAAILSAQHTFAVDTISFTLTGYDIDTVLGKQFAAEVAAFTLTGSDISVTKQLALQAAQQTYDFVGNNASIFVGAGSLVAEVGIFTLTGYDATGTHYAMGEIIEASSNLNSEITLTSNMTTEMSLSGNLNTELNLTSNLM